VRLPDPGAGAFGLCVANGRIYTLVDHGRSNPDKPERSELCALDWCLCVRRRRVVLGTLGNVI
jgi:hypothetical protein